MDVEINWIAVVLAAISSMIVGCIWYSKPVFGKAWMKLVGLDDKQQQAGDAAAILLAFVASLVTAYVLALVTYLSQLYYGLTYIDSALNTAILLWLGISATTVVTHNAFEQKPHKLTALTVVYQLVNLMVMAAVIGWLGP